MTLISAPAFAHVKWFASWDIICPPRNPIRVLTTPLWQAFFLVCVAAIAALAMLDWRLTRAGGALQLAREKLHAAVMPKALLTLRVGVAIYWTLVAFTLPDAVYLTPELSAPSRVAWLQGACAVLVLSRRTAWLAGVSMIFMYVMAIIDHGWFHLLDYPLFLAIGVILVMTSREGAQVDVLALKILRWGASLTLLWGGVEKFAYPEWSFPLLQNIPLLSLGVSPEAAMYMYGFAELALSFGLLLFNVGSQVSAALLLFIFVGAMQPFGWIDLVGHSGICVALLLLTLVKPQGHLVLRRPEYSASVHAALFTSAVVGLLAAYFGLHEIYRPDTARRPFENQMKMRPSEPRSAAR